MVHAKASHKVPPLKAYSALIGKESRAVGRDPHNGDRKLLGFTSGNPGKCFKKLYAVRYPRYRLIHHHLYCFLRHPYLIIIIIIIIADSSITAQRYYRYHHSHRHHSNYCGILRGVPTLWVPAFRGTNWCTQHQQFQIDQY
ncbi:hypothetical protein PoB_002987200 [Plakobranchus ocellatus]|uniref:Uncharacterized protein n=1 Tax=Plakobranchus ocellatus TaxID=259542 RepID=A0AAV4A7W1_9GAST|nr:hypothetical protein PoB_002987200 [Plakobranchus ocellatus]